MKNPLQTRRELLLSTLGSAAFLATERTGIASQASHFPPTRVITRGPDHHWFGYYDKLQFDPSSRYVLGMRVEFRTSLSST